MSLPSLCIPYFIQDGFCLGSNSSSDLQGSSSQNSITRKAGGRKEAEKEKQVGDIVSLLSIVPCLLAGKYVSFLICLVCRL